MLRRYDQFLEIIKKIFLVLSTSILAVIVIINITNILSNMIFSRRFDWVFEVSLILFVYAVLFHVPVLYKNKEYLKMNILNQLELEKPALYMGLIIELMILFVLVLLSYHAVYLSWGQRSILSRGLRIARAWVTLPMCICAITLLLFNINSIILGVRDILIYHNVLKEISE